jgi:hypothetical protein
MGLVARVEAFTRELPDDVEDLEPRAVVAANQPQEALVHEGPEQVEDLTVELVVGAHAFRCLERGASTEHGHAAEHALLRVVEEVVAPCDRTLQRLLPGRPVASAALEDRERPVEPVEDL